MEISRSRTASRIGRGLPLIILASWLVLTGIALFQALLADYNNTASASTIPALQGPVFGTGEVEPNDCPASANPIFGTGQTVTDECGIVTGEISTTGDVDYYSFIAPAGAKVWAYVDTGGAATGTSRDSVLSLFGTCSVDGPGGSPELLIDPCGLPCVQLLELDDNDGTGNGCDSSTESFDSSAIAGFTVPQAGQYFLRVEEAGNDGTIIPYKLFVVITTSQTGEVEPNDVPEQAQQIFGTGQTSGVVAGTMSADPDVYKVCLAAGDTLYVNWDGDPNGDGGADASIDLVGPDAVTILFTANSSNATGDPPPPAEAFCFNIQTAGTYYIRLNPIVAGEYTLMVSRCGTGTPVCTEGECQIQCPPMFTTSNDPNLCGAFVNYPAVMSTGDCGEVTCNPPPGAFFPVGDTTVNCMSESGQQCSFVVRVLDTQDPTITCPPDVVAQGNGPTPVFYTTPTASDNCSASVSCVPPSGSTFPVGTTTVTCTATDPSGNTATCTFNVTVNQPGVSFDICIQDDSNGSVLLFNSQTGDYLFCCSNGFTISGKGIVSQAGCVIALQQSPSETDRRVVARVDTCTHQGGAEVQSPPGVSRCTIFDSNTTNNTCTCPGSPT